MVYYLYNVSQDGDQCLLKEASDSLGTENTLMSIFPVVPYIHSVTIYCYLVLTPAQPRKVNYLRSYGQQATKPKECWMTSSELSL